MDLEAIYARHFAVVRADTPERRAQVFRLRYQVYCLEHEGYEDPQRFPDGLESDEYDERALHSLLVHRPGGVVAGTVRMVLPSPVAKPPLPIQRVCPGPPPFPTATTGEVSRFSISKQFRRRSTDGAYPDELAPARRPAGRSDDPRLIPSMTIGLIRDLVAMSQESGVTHWCAVMMPSLLRLLGRLGIHFLPMGPMVEFHGLRQPCYRDLTELLEQAHAEQPAIWAFLTDRGRLWPPRRERSVAGL
jgi:N-acyl amino acid synthase of PEP-CTERM/exosortase system